MFKNTLIVLLTILLAAAAFVTRPNEPSFRQLITDGRQPAPTPPRDLKQTVRDLVISAAENQLEPVTSGDYQFKDRILWVDVQRDGRTEYTGLLSHWFRRTPKDRSFVARGEN